MRIIHRITAVVVMFAFAFGFTSVSEARRGGRDRIREQVKWDAVPPVVQATIRENAAGGKIGAIEKETRRGATTYEAEVKRTDGRTIAIEVAESGKLISVEVEPSADAGD